MTGGGLYGTDGDDLGHGHVAPRPDGLRRDCGGPGVCPLCTAEQAQQREANADVERRRTARAALLAAEVRHDRRVTLSRRPGDPGLMWRSRCTCGQFESAPIRQDAALDSSRAIEQVKAEWSDHALGSTVADGADAMLAQWSRS